MAYKIEIKDKAINLRKQGYSIKEIAKLLSIAKSTSSAWLGNILLSPKAQKRLKSRRILGQYKSMEIARQKREKQQLILTDEANKLLTKIVLTPDIYKLCCALLFWCEGNKNTTSLKFTNSDPILISNFLYLLRAGFNIDESKLRALVHIHEYHDDLSQKKFWSEITKIPLSQFHRSYKKPNTGKRYKDNYPGCLGLVYYDASVAKELKAVYNSFSKLRGVR